jgi:hypothetical protein
MVDSIKYKKKYKESVQPLGIGDPLVGAGLGGGMRKRAILDSKADKLMGATSLAIASAPGAMIAKGFHDVGEKRKASIKKRKDMIKESEDRKKELKKRILNVQQKHKAARYKNVKTKKRSY